MLPISLVDVNCGLDRGYLADLAEMLTVVSQTQFALEPPFGYNQGAVARVANGVKDVAPGEVPFYFLSKADQPDALAYHYVNNNGAPYAEVFPKLLIDPADIGVSTSHELFELLGDPSCALACVGPDGIVRAYEVCDPVEATWFPYTTARGTTVRCSNWVTPLYFSPSPNGTGKLDRMGLVSRPFEILDGGYELCFNPITKSWAQAVNGVLSDYRQKLNQLLRSKTHKRNTLLTR